MNFAVQITFQEVLVHTSWRNLPSPEVVTRYQNYYIFIIFVYFVSFKGNSCNIGVIAREPAYLPYIREQLTEEVVSKYFAHAFEVKSR